MSLTLPKRRWEPTENGWASHPRDPAEQLHFETLEEYLEYVSRRDNKLMRELLKK